MFQSTSKQCPKCRGFDFNTEFRVLKEAPTFRGKKLEKMFGNFPNVKVNMNLEKATKTADGHYKLYWRCTEKQCNFKEEDIVSHYDYMNYAVRVGKFTQISGV